MAVYEKKMHGDFDYIVSQIENAVLNCSVSINIIERSNFISGDTRVAVRVFDKYFFKNGGRASLNVTVIGVGENVFVSAVGSGDSSKLFAKFTNGAKKQLLGAVKETLEENEI